MSRIRTNLITNRMANGAPTVSNGLIISGVTTVTTLDLNGDLDVDGHTNLDNVSISGISSTGKMVSTISSPDPYNTVNTNLELVNGAGNQGAGSRIDFTCGNGKAHIQSQVTGGNSNSGLSLVFATSPDANGADERLRIDSSGSLFAGGTPLTESDLNWGHDTYQRPHIFSGNTGGTPSDGAIVAASVTENPSNSRIGAFIFGCKTSSTSGVSNSGLKAFIEGCTNTNVSDAWKTGGYMKFSTRADNAISPEERLRITSDGKLLLGTTTTTNNIRAGNKFGIVGTAAYTGMSISQYAGTTGNHKPMIDFNRSRGTSDQSMTSVAENDGLGEIIFRGADGNSFEDGAAIRAFVDGTPGNSDMPGRLTFHTSGDGTTTLTERVRINKDGYVTAPYQPSFNVTITTIGQINSNAGVIIFNNTTSLGNHNVGNHYNTSNGRFTAPVAGRYQFNARMLTNSSTTSYTIYLLRVNANHVGYIGHNHSDYWFMESGSFILNLQANDYVDCYLQQHSGHGGHNYASFSGFLIG